MILTLDDLTAFGEPIFVDLTGVPTLPANPPECECGGCDWSEDEDDPE